LLEQIDALSQQIQRYDDEIEQQAAQGYPETALIRDCGELPIEATA
jgi:hypothetical protein